MTVQRTGSDWTHRVSADDTFGHRLVAHSAVGCVHPYFCASVSGCTHASFGSYASLVCLCWSNFQSSKDV